ncbi:MAG TPA: Swt1 family HEPN domain-containing protein [Candidatus Bathyarchaeia archaeon]
MIGTTSMEDVKKFVLDGALASKEVQDVGKTIDLGGAQLVTDALPAESTDPSWYPQELIVDARRMAQCYVRLYLFENKVRQMTDTVLSESHGTDWFDNVVDSGIHKEAVRRQEEIGTARFHGRRASKPLDFVGLPDLGRIIVDNWPDFEDILYRKEWVTSRFEDLRLIRNATAHMGAVSDDDLHRLDVILRDWNRQVG